MSWNPRYVDYATAHGRTPEEMLKHDAHEYPGGCMTGFMVWINQQKEAFHKARPECFLDRWLIHDQEAWDAWLHAAALAA